jgi:predicted nucleic acid-binding protein
MICYLDSSALVKLFVDEPAAAVGLVPYPQDVPELLESRKT